MRKSEVVIDKRVRVTKPSPDWYSSTMEAHVGRILTIAQAQVGPYVLCEETGEVPFHIDWLEEVPAKSLPNLQNIPIKTPEGAKIRQAFYSWDYTDTKLYTSDRVQVIDLNAPFRSIANTLFGKPVAYKEPDYASIEKRMMEHMEKTQPAAQQADNCNCTGKDLLHFGHRCGLGKKH